MDTVVTALPLHLVVRTLEEDIVLGYLHPRERLIETDLMNRFGILRHTARTALARLVQLGLVEHRKNVGACVRSFSHREVMELYEMRELLECEALSRMQCPARTEDIATLTAMQQAHDQAVEQRDARQVFRANMAFHTTLFALCPNKVLVEAIRNYAVQTHAIRSSLARLDHAQDKARAEHHAMIQALAQGIRTELLRLGKQHLTPSRDEYLATNKAYMHSFTG